MFLTVPCAPGEPHPLYGTAHFTQDPPPALAPPHPPPQQASPPPPPLQQQQQLQLQQSHDNQVQLRANLALQRKPLMAACLSGDFHAVEMLLNVEGAEPINPASGVPPLHAAAKNGHLHIVRLLADKGGAILDVADPEGEVGSHLTPSIQYSRLTFSN